MSRIVMKFGGTSVGSVERINHVAKIVKSEVDLGNQIVVVLSAMAGETDKLINLTKDLSKSFENSEYDVVISSGEQVSAGALSGLLNSQGIKAQSRLGWQIPIVTSGDHKSARIEAIHSKELINLLELNEVIIIPGFQGINSEGRITTLGRGGSDTSAVAIAAAIDADFCDIYTDVDGVYTSDPNKVPTAKRLDKISYEEMLEMASLGAKVMQPVSIQDARLNRIDIEVKSSFIKKPGTLITKKSNVINNRIITGISSTHNDAKVTLIGVKDKPGVAASIFKPLSENMINVDMVVQNISANGKETDLTFTIKTEDLNKTKKIIKSNRKIKFRKLLLKKDVSKISVIGVGMITTPGVTFRMFQTLANKKINIQVISTSEIKISVLIDKKDTKKALFALHKEFKLDN